jgi:hypothetical protein
MATSPTQDCYIALELSRSKWLVGALLPGRSKITTTLVPGGDTAALLDVLTRLAARAALTTGSPVALKVCYEAGYDGFWLARFLIGHGIETHVLDPASFLVSAAVVAPRQIGSMSRRWSSPSKPSCWGPQRLPECHHPLARAGGRQAPLSRAQPACR